MGLLESARGLLEERAGVTFLATDQLKEMHEGLRAFAIFREEAEDLAYHAMDYFSGRPHEMRAERRIRLAQRSRTALQWDPNAGAEAQLLANFALGNGIGQPQCNDDEVQDIVDAAWSDPVNAAKLTSFEAQRHRSNELITQANLFPTAYVKNGRVRLGFLDADVVLDVVVDPEDDERPLWYVAKKRRFGWDFKNHRPDVKDVMRDGVMPEVKYWPHWRNVDDYLEEEGQGAEKPESKDLAPGLVEHVRINRVGRTQFGIPPWARVLRYFNAMSVLTESHVAMAQAASSIIAKRVMSGSPESVTRAANAVLSQGGELAAARFGDDPRADPLAPHGQPPLDPGSFWLENEQHRLESVKLDSGAGQMLQTGELVRAPIAANAQFGPHYFGSPGDINLATASSLELPALMNVSAWQETFKQMLCWFIDLVIEEAVKAGRLGGLGQDGTSGKPISELRIQEAEDKADMEKRTGKDLGYEFQMPYPGRRNLPDVVTLVDTVATAYDPLGMNIPLRRKLLAFLATHGLQVADPQGWVDEVLPEGSDPVPFQPLIDPNAVDPNADPNAPPETGGGGKGKPMGGPSSQYGEKTQGTTPKDAMAQALAELDEETVGIFEREFAPVYEVITRGAEAAREAASTNGGS